MTGMKKTLAALAIALSPGLALADIPPPKGYVEQCTVEKACKKGEEGTECRGWHGDPEGCSNRLSPAGWEARCQTRGASVWTEVFCRPKGPKKQGPPKKEESVAPPGKDEPATTPAAATPPAPAPAKPVKKPVGKKTTAKTAK